MKCHRYKHKTDNDAYAFEYYHRSNVLLCFNASFMPRKEIPEMPDAEQMIYSLRSEDTMLYINFHF